MRRRIAAIAVALALAALTGLYLPGVLDKSRSLPRHSGMGMALTDGFQRGRYSSPDVLDTLELDNRGVLLYDYGPDLGKHHNPVFIAGFVLNLVPLKDHPVVLETIYANLDHLLDSAVATAGGNLLFPYDFDFAKMGQRAPWYSAMAQGHAASALLWGYRISGQDRYLDGARRAVLAMTEPDQGLARRLGRGVWLKEFPAFRFHILDGSLVALSGVYDLYRTLPPQDPDRHRVKDFLDQGLSGFKACAACFETPFGGVYFSDDRRRLRIGQSYYSMIMQNLEYLAGYDPELLDIRARYSYVGMGEVRRLLLSWWISINSDVFKTIAQPSPCVR